MKNYLKALSMLICIILAVFLMQLPRLLEIENRFVFIICSGVGIPIAVIVNQVIFNKINNKYKHTK